MGCRGVRQKRNKRKGAGSLAAVRLWCLIYFSLDVTGSTKRKDTQGCPGESLPLTLCVTPLCPSLDAGGGPNLSLTLREILRLSEKYSFTESDGEPYALPCPTLLPCVLQTAPDWRRKHFLTFHTHIDVLHHATNTTKHLGGFQSFALTTRLL